MVLDPKFFSLAKDKFCRFCIFSRVRKMRNQVSEVPPMPRHCTSLHCESWILFNCLQCLPNTFLSSNVSLCCDNSFGFIDWDQSFSPKTNPRLGFSEASWHYCDHNGGRAQKRRLKKTKEIILWKIAIYENNSKSFLRIFCILAQVNTFRFLFSAFGIADDSDDESWRTETTLTFGGPRCGSIHL